MQRKRFSEEQIIPILKEAEAGVPLPELLRKYAISAGTYSRNVIDGPALQGRRLATG